jgi:hypothetical protein
MSLDPLNKLCKWRSVLAGWVAGTQAINDPGAKGLRDLMDKTLIYRVELSALAALLIKKGVFTAQEFTDQINIEAGTLDSLYQIKFDGFETFEHGVKIDAARARKTMNDLGFPP